MILLTLFLISLMMDTMSLEVLLYQPLHASFGAFRSTNLGFHVMSMTHTWLGNGR